MVVLELLISLKVVEEVVDVIVTEHAVVKVVHVVLCSSNNCTLDCRRDDSNKVGNCRSINAGICYGVRTSSWILMMAVVKAVVKKEEKEKKDRMGWSTCFKSNK